MRFLPLALAAFLATPALAQINTEQLRKSTEDGIHLQFDAGGGFSSGNTDILQLGVGVRLDVREGNNSGFGLARYTLSEVDDVTDVSNAFAHIRYNAEVVPRVIGEVLAQYERNEQTLLARRYIGGAGLRFEFVETEAIGIALGTTPMIESERLRPEAMEDPTTSFRWSNYLALRVDVSDTAEAFGVVYVQPRVEALSDYRIFHESRLDLHVTRFVKVRLRGMVRYDSQPPIGVEDTDVMLTTGFVFNSLGN